MCAHRGLLSSYKSEGIKMVDAITHGLVEVLSNDSQTHNTSNFGVRRDERAVCVCVPGHCITHCTPYSKNGSRGYITSSVVGFRFGGGGVVI